MTASIDYWAGTGFVDRMSSDGRICVREEARGEIFRMTTAEYWHLNREFDGRSVFFGSGINAFIDPECRFLVLRDCSVILLFDYIDETCWHAEEPWRYTPGVMRFPEIEFSNEAILIGRFREAVPRGRLEQFFAPGLGRSKDGFLTHWRQGGTCAIESAERLQGRSILLAGCPQSEQAGTGQPVTRPVVKPEGGEKPQPESEGRSR